MNQNLLIQLLEDLNLTTLETKIYELLVVRGPTPAGEIAKRIGSHRRNVYDAIDRMVSKGFLAYIKQNNIKLYQIQDPNKILEGLKQKQKDWEIIIPEIKQNMEHWQDKKETLFFRGQTGIKQVFLEMANSKTDVLVTATSKDPETIVKYFFPKYENIKKENKITTKMICDLNTSDNVKEKLSKLENTQIKFAKNLNSSVVSEYVFENNVATVLWLDEEPSVILVKGSENMQFHKDRFNFIWENI